MKVLLGVTGSVAAKLLPKLANAILDAGHELQVVMTRSATYFYDPERAITEKDEEEFPTATPWAKVRVWKEKDEWFRMNHLHVVKHFGRYATVAYQGDDVIPHIDLRKWADVFVVAPLSANTLAKMSIGMNDNLLTSVFRAWDFDKPVLLAPAMNTFMWSNPWTEMQMNILSALQGPHGGHHVRFIDPQSKLLACGDTGVGAMAEIAKIVEAINALSPKE